MTPLTLSQKHVVVNKSLAFIYHVKKLKISLESIMGNKVTLRLPYQKELIGNPDNGVLHSGVITSLLDTACGISTTCSDILPPSLCPTLDLRIDHLATAPAGNDIYATACVYRVTSRVVFVEAIAFCDSRHDPFARATANFVRLLDLDTSHLLDAGGEL